MDSIAELKRRLTNLATLGTVADVDISQARCRVTIGDLKTDWLPWLTLRAGADRDWWPPSPGEQVLVISPGGDPAQGIALPAIYSDEHSAPDNRSHTRRIRFSDGTEITYDHQKKLLVVDCVGEITVVARSDIIATSTEGNIVATATAGAIQAVAEEASVTAPKITLNGAVKINGSLTLAGPLSAGPGDAGSGAQFEGDFSVQGDIETEGALRNNGKAVGSDLRVTGVTPGSGNSGNPV
ncbi:phage baseplate assembly protein V [Alloalcanivorax xenomutans]|uniref:phage baseplate assembly protein V n=1 Tax=Alloalcanivorax xenomutans TaxID=1094342 RepID=UPI003BA924EA